MRPLTPICQPLNSQHRAPLRETAENRPDLRLASKDRHGENAPDVLADLDITAQSQRVYRWALAALAHYPPVRSQADAIRVAQALRQRYATSSVNLITAVMKMQTGFGVSRRRTPRRAPLLPEAYAALIQLDLSPAPSPYRTRAAGRPPIAIGPAVATQALLGLRIGELRGLTWRDLDLAQGTVTIRQQRIAATVSALKTDHASRTLPLPEALSKALRRWQLRSGAQTFVFPSTAKTITLRLHALCRALKLPPITPHALRHGYATALLAHGVDVNTVSHLLGHADANFTLKTYCAITNQGFEHARSVVQSFASAKSSSKVRKPSAVAV